MAAAIVACALVVGGFGAGRAFSLACAGDLQVYDELERMLGRLRPAPPPGPAGEEPLAAEVDQAEEMSFDAVRGVLRSAIEALLRLKQNDEIAYRAHSGLADLLDFAACSTGALRVQWLKAALHAPEERAAEHVAAALRRTAEAGGGDTASLADEVDALAERESWSSGIRRVAAALRPDGASVVD